MKTRILAATAQFSPSKRRRDLNLQLENVRAKTEVEISPVIPQGRVKELKKSFDSMSLVSVLDGRRVRFEVKEVEKVVQRRVKLNVKPNLPMTKSLREKKEMLGEDVLPVFS